MVVNRRLVDQLTELGDVFLQSRLHLHRDVPRRAHRVNELNRRPQLEITLSRLGLLAPDEDRYDGDGHPEDRHPLESAAI